MSFKLLVILLFTSSFSWGQIVYTSAKTQFFPSTEIKSITRTLDIKEDYIKITTTPPNGEEKVQVLAIAKKFRRNIEDVINSGESMIYNCVSEDDNLEYVITIPETPKVEFIDVHIPEQPGSDAKYYRFLLD